MSIELQASEALRHIALDETVKSYVLQNPPIYQALRHAAMRFMGKNGIYICAIV